jgi:hypothetical protein
MSDDEMDIEFQAVVGNETVGEGEAWLTTPPWAIRYRPVRVGDWITGARIVVEVRGLGLRSDLRALSNPRPGLSTVEVASELNWYRNPAAPIEIGDVPFAKVMVEEEVPYPVDALPPETDRAYDEALRLLRRTPAEGSPWPLRLPTRAQYADALVGRRVVVRLPSSDGTWRDIRNHRAVSPIVPSQRDPNEQMVRFLDEASWYSGWADPTTPMATGTDAVCVWVE